ncbi:MAG: FAD-dependent thymidylate synthase [Chlamydiales bacterium]
MEEYEKFTDEQTKILQRFVTNTTSNIFVLHNLPEVIKGALFSRYSRSSLGLRSLLLKEFVLGEETEFASIVGKEAGGGGDQFIAIKKAQNFYDRILDGYGDDSIGELGGAHVAIENISMLAAKMLEDRRIGGSPLEKSTRYIYFDQKVNDQYLYYHEPIIMTSAYRDIYLETCDMLFETYSRLIPPMTELMEKKFPKDPEISKGAYNAALRAKVLDCLRGLLPAGTLTNMGIFGNGRFWEGLIGNLQTRNLAELQAVGQSCYTELAKVIPSFVRRSEQGHHNQGALAQFLESMHEQLKNVAEKHEIEEEETVSGVRLISHDPESVFRVAAALLYEKTEHSLEALYQHCRKLLPDQIAEIFDAASLVRENRRHKSPRALEHAFFTFEVVADFGIYRDLHRHRMLTQERQLLTTNYGYFIPREIEETPMEKEYHEAMTRAHEVYCMIAEELPEEAQYVVPMGYNVRWYFHVNLRALQWLCELRSSPAGHPNYRHVAQEMAKQVIRVHPAFECFFKFVDYDGYELGRLGQEQRKAEKMESKKHL